MRLSIVIPALNEAAAIGTTLARLAPLRARGHDVLLADGGSDDGTAAVAAAAGVRVVVAPRGRASQMNAGARAARGEVLLFLHADTLLPPEADRLIAAGLAGGSLWGRFDLRLTGRQPLLRAVERLSNWRSRLTGIATGDQAIFVRRALFDHVGGFPPIPLMEDVALSRRLRRQSRPYCVRTPVHTSSRRWEQRGVLRTIALMWYLRTAHALGVPAERLARLYR
jgi:rSAM/selenodomain-associated transferase 2